MSKLVKSLQTLSKSVNESISVGDGECINKIELLVAMFSASQRAWEEAIQPVMQKIRIENVKESSIKDGNDFFTEADIKSEKIITEFLVSRFGEDAFRIFGEEKNEYIGNLDSNISIRIDPIDGTEAFKFGSPNWSIMIGVYIGKGEEEQQCISTVYHPEYYDQLIFYLDALGVFIGDACSGELEEVAILNKQDNLSNIIIAYYKHSNCERRGEIDGIIRELDKNGARTKSLSPSEVRESLITRGKRAMVIDGDFNQVDFISYSLLVSLGYAVYAWGGEKQNVDDPMLADKKIVFVPPGKAGQEILRIIKEVL